MRGLRFGMSAVLCGAAVVMASDVFGQAVRDHRDPRDVPNVRELRDGRDPRDGREVRLPRDVVEAQRREVAAIRIVVSQLNAREEVMQATPEIYSLTADWISRGTALEMELAAGDRERRQAAEAGVAAIREVEAHGARIRPRRGDSLSRLERAMRRVYVGEAELVLLKDKVRTREVRPQDVAQAEDKLLEDAKEMVEGVKNRAERAIITPEFTELWHEAVLRVAQLELTRARGPQRQAIVENLWRELQALRVRVESVRTDYEGLASTLLKAHVASVESMLVRMTGEQGQRAAMRASAADARTLEAVRDVVNKLDVKVRGEDYGAETVGMRQRWLRRKARLELRMVRDEGAMRRIAESMATAARDFAEGLRRRRALDGVSAAIADAGMREAEVVWEQVKSGVDLWHDDGR
jgi:hypothetical protein